VRKRRIWIGILSGVILLAGSVFIYDVYIKQNHDFVLQKGMSWLQTDDSWLRDLVWFRSDGAPLIPPLRLAVFSPDGQKLAIPLGGFGELGIFRVSDGRLMRVLGRAPHRGDPRISALGFSSRGKLLVLWSGSGGPTLELTGNEVTESSKMLALYPKNFLNRGYNLERSFNSSFFAAFSPDGQWLASGLCEGKFPNNKCEPREIKLWRVDSGRLVRTLKGHAHSVVELVFSPDGQLLS